MPPDDDHSRAVEREPAASPIDGRSGAGLTYVAHTVATRDFLSLSAPRPIDGRPRQAGFLARGLESLHHLPGPVASSGLRCRAHRLQLRGQPGHFTRVPLNPHTGELVVWRYVAAKNFAGQ